MIKTLHRLSRLAACGLLVAGIQGGAATFTVDPSATWVGYMNVFETPQNGGGYLWGQAWGTADLPATWSGAVLTLGPNSINDPAAYWYTPSGGPGAIGNKKMDASFYQETTGVYTGQTITFTGQVLSNTLVGKTNQAGNGWTSVAFIKDFAPDYSSSVSQTVPLVDGIFSVSLNAINDPARHIQFGFETIGPDVWATDVSQYGTVQLTAVPEPGTLALLALGCSIPLVLRRRQ